jgi:hypothetical protein
MSKIRIDYVTNSSSSSYVLAFRNPSSDLITEDELNRLSLSVKKIVSSALKAYKNIINEANYNISTKEELDEMFVKEHCRSKYPTLESLFEYDKDYKEQYNEYLNYINQGYTIAEFTVDYNESETTGELLSNIADGENIIMIQEGD